MSESRCEAVVAQNNLGILVADARGRFVSANRAACSLLGYEEAELLGQPIACLYPGTHAPHVAAFLVGKSRRSVEHATLVAKDGRGLAVTVVRTPIRDASGQVAGVSAVLFEQPMLRDVERQLRLSEERLKEAQRIGNVGNWHYDLVTHATYASAELLRILDLEEEELSLVDAFGRFGTEAVSSLHRAVAEALDSERSVAFEIEVIAGGATKWLHNVVSAVRAPNGRWVRIAGTVHDVTERRVSEAAEARYANRMRQADKLISLGTIVTSTAHELNNPAHAIELMASVLRDAMNDALPILDAHAATNPELTVANLPYAEARTELPRAVAVIQDSCKRIQNVIAELGRFAHPDEVAHSAIDLNVVVRSALTLLRGRLRRATTRFDTRYRTELPRVFGSATSLQQCVVNLLLNACEALDKEEQAIAIRTDATPDERHVLLTVRDDGVGIEEHLLSRLTEPFYTTKADVGASGLGLTVTERIIVEHGGFLRFESAPGAGMAATIALPVWGGLP